MRWAIGIEYDGTRYSGWQTQPDGQTVQDALQRALSRVADHSVVTQCAGRTDAGVHAIAQVAHFDSHASRTNRQWLLGINTNLPKDVNVSWIKPVDETFHARFSAKARRYRYVILNREHRSALLRHRVHFEPRAIDVERMHDSAQVLLGEHDFAAFRASGCQARSPVRVVHHIAVSRYDDLVAIDIEANAFLQNMVRIVTGALLRIGRLEADTPWLQRVLESRDRRHLGPTAPADGLYLTGVDYPAQYGLPVVQRGGGALPFAT
ncbi:MAG: tRNA pseudouridine(38-40) synthase TruA [Pseudomonadota bacterium]